MNAPTPRQQLIRKLRELAREAEFAREPAVEAMLVEIVASMHDQAEEAAALAFLRFSRQRYSAMVGGVN